jgi:DNA helicase II / ATP-dependent DNA helicase PcrA
MSTELYESRISTPSAAWPRDARDLRTFVAELLLDPPASSAALAGPAVQDDDWLVLSTVHSAKGLEWQGVHLIAAYDGNFPSDLAADSRESLAEERRLLYVAVTRARRSLTIYVPRRYYHRKDRGDSHGYGKASRFLSAAARACCDVVHLPDDPPRMAPTATAKGRRIEVSVDDLSPERSTVPCATGTLCQTSGGAVWVRHGT